FIVKDVCREPYQHYFVPEELPILIIRRLRFRGKDISYRVNSVAITRRISVSKSDRLESWRDGLRLTKFLQNPCRKRLKPHVGRNHEPGLLAGLAEVHMTNNSVKILRDIHETKPIILKEHVRIG